MPLRFGPFGSTFPTLICSWPIYDDLEWVDLLVFYPDTRTWSCAYYWRLGYYLSLLPPEELARATAASITIK